MTIAGRAVSLVVLCAAAFPQTHTMTQGAHRMELLLERREGSNWKTIDPGLVLAQNDFVRFRFRTNFDGYLYVTNFSTSGAYDLLFPNEKTGQENRVTAGKEYLVPATTTAFRISGPPGHEVVYWMVTPVRLAEPAPHFEPPDHKATPLTLIPRCDDAILHARGDCIDSSAGPKLVPRGEDIPQSLVGPADAGRRDLLFMRQKDTAVISSPAPLTGPVVYEFRLAHR
jgi:hypothetical protein